MSGEMPYVWASYIITWVAIGVYAFMIMRRAEHARREMEER